MCELNELMARYEALGIARQDDYAKFYLYSLITHSTAIEGSTVTEVENQVMFDEGLSVQGRTLVEQFMNLDLKAAYERALQLVREGAPLTAGLLKELAALVMKNTGSVYSTPMGTFDSSKGELRLVNVTAGVGGRSYMDCRKVGAKLDEFCELTRRELATVGGDLAERYKLSFEAHYRLVSIHPWVDGNGRMARLVMNMLQAGMGLVLSRVDKGSKAAYIQALVDSRDGESSEPFCRFMMGEHMSNLRKEIATFERSREQDPLTH